MCVFTHCAYVLALWYWHNYIYTRIYVVFDSFWRLLKLNVSSVVPSIYTSVHIKESVSVIYHVCMALVSLLEMT